MNIALETLYESLSSKIDKKYLIYENNTIYIYPKITLSFIALRASRIILSGVVITYIFHMAMRTPTNPHDWNNMPFYVAGLMIIGMIGDSLLFRAILCSKKQWLMKIGPHDISMRSGLFKKTILSIDWEKIADLSFNQGQPKAFRKEEIAPHICITPTADTTQMIQKKPESLILAGFFQGWVPLPLHDFYELLHTFWVDNVRQS